jgi:hypothetical protein
MIPDKSSERKTIWHELQAHKKRKVSPEQLAAEIQRIRDEARN